MIPTSETIGFISPEPEFKPRLYIYCLSDFGQGT